MDWKELGHNIEKGIILTRSDSVEKKYREHMNSLKEREVDINQAVTEALFTEDRLYAITLNTFPYNLKKGIIHYILWINPEREISFELIKIMSNKIFGENFIKRNPKENQTVKGVVHYHVFCKRGPKKITNRNFTELNL